MAEVSHLKTGFPFPDILVFFTTLFSFPLSFSFPLLVCFLSLCMEANDSIYSYNIVAKPTMFLLLLVIYLIIQVHLHGSSYLIRHAILSHFQNGNAPFECILYMLHLNFRGTVYKHIYKLTHGPNLAYQRTFAMQLITS